MKDHDGDFRGFYHSGEAWHWPASKTRDEVDHVSLGFYSPDGGTSGEMSVRWVQLSRGTPVPQLCAFDDAWHTLAQFGDLIAAMADLDNQNISPLDFCALLRRLGFVDLTQRTQDPRDVRHGLLVQLRHFDWSDMPTDRLEAVVAAASS